MSERVAFLPAGVPSPVPFAELGGSPEGRWGLVSDQPWLALQGNDPLELLYLSRTDYEHAVRRLPAAGLAAAIAHRRNRYARNLPTRALGTFEGAIRASLALVKDRPAGSRARSDLLTALASFTVVSRFVHSKPLDLLDYLREGDAELMAELEAMAREEPPGFDPDGSERETRRRFATAFGQVAATRGRPEKAKILPYFDVERVYFVVPGLPELEARAMACHDPMHKWRGGLVLPLSRRQTPELIAQNQQFLVLFPSPGSFVSARIELDPGQLEIELAERTESPGFADYLDARRVGQAILRTAVYLLTGTDAELNAVLAAQTRQEAELLGTWLRSSAAVPGQARVALVTAIGHATLLAALCRRRQDEDTAGTLDALARAVSHVIAEGI